MYFAVAFSFIYFFYLCLLNMNTVDYLDINILWKIQLLFSREGTFILLFLSFKSEECTECGTGHFNLLQKKNTFTSSLTSCRLQCKAFCTILNWENPLDYVLHTQSASNKILQQSWVTSWLKEQARIEFKGSSSEWEYATLGNIHPPPLYWG